MRKRIIKNTTEKERETDDGSVARATGAVQTPLAAHRVEGAQIVVAGRRYGHAVFCGSRRRARNFCRGWRQAVGFRLVARIRFRSARQKGRRSFVVRFDGADGDVVHTRIGRYHLDGQYQNQHLN